MGRSPSFDLFKLPENTTKMQSGDTGFGGKGDRSACRRVDARRRGSPEEALVALSHLRFNAVRIPEGTAVGADSVATCIVIERGGPRVDASRR